MNDLVINEKNFEEYFFDARKNAPQKGQVMAKYIAIAELVEGTLKKDLINLLKLDKAAAAVSVLSKLGGAKYQDAVKICLEISNDLLSGLSEDEILAKPYKFTLEHFFYTQKDYVPKGDPHWETIDLLFDREDLNNQIQKLTETIDE